jgi:uncharacterized protein YbaP (TraB family)
MKKLARVAAILAVWGCGLGIGVAQQAAPAGPGGGADKAAAVAADGAAAKPGETQAAANPAWWQVKGVHGTLYLLGSVHVMKPNVQWESPRLKAALDASDELYLEIANADDSAAMAPLALQFGMDMDHPLSSKLSKDDVALLDTVAKGIGLPGEAMLEPMQPWFVSATLEMVPMLKDGYDPASGIDLKLLAESKREQKRILGFETMSDQLHMMADVPQAEQVTMLHEQLTELDKSAADMNELVAAWERGDVEKIAGIDNRELAVKHPAEYKRMVVDRNTRWAATLDSVLKDPSTGTVFVVVGAGHLAGPDSVLKMLEKDGWKIQRE